MTQAIFGLYFSNKLICSRQIEIISSKETLKILYKDIDEITKSFGGVPAVPWSFLIGIEGEIIKTYPGAILKDYDPILYQDFTFIHFGCGLGRPLLIASKFKFCKLIAI